MLDLLQLSPESLELIQSAISAVSSFMSSILSIFIYVGVSVGLFRMSKSCGMKHAWISFIPYAQSYRMGQIADHQCKYNEGKSTKYRVWLLVLQLVQMATLVVWYTALYIAVIASIVSMTMNGTLESVMQDPNYAYDLTFQAMLDTWFTFIPFLAASITYTVFCSIAMYKSAKLYIPKIAALAVVLYLFLTPAQPILYLVMGARKPRYVSDGPDEQLPEGGEDMFYTL